MIQTLTKMKSSNELTYIIVGFMSMLVFCLIYGVRVLDPTYTDWLMQGGDISCHYLGWKAYRTGEWMFPIGCTDYLSYPDKMSVIFTDSIPVFAVFFKILSPMLPVNFQYFGFWGILCFALQGVLSARIIIHFTKNQALIIITSLLFVFTPVMIWRMFAHTALAGHWILILALETVFVYKAYSESRKIFVIWTIVGILAPAIHIYFVLMCGIILVGYCIVDIAEFKRIKRSFFLLADYIFSVVFTVWILGGFYSNVSSADAGLGIYSVNLNALFNPQGWSCIYKDLPLYGAGQYEGFAYLGAGFVFLFFISILWLAGNYKIKIIFRNNLSEVLAFGLIFFASSILALSPVITLGDRVIFEWILPEIIIRYWSVFRASGRIIWIADYLVMFCSCMIIFKTWTNKKMCIVLMSFCILCQICDIRIIMSDRNNTFNQKAEYRAVALKDEDVWKQIGKNHDIEHMVLMQTVSIEQLYDFTEWALNNGKTVNQFYFARELSSTDENRQKALENPDNSEIFIFTKENMFSCLKYDLNYYFADDFIIGYTGFFDSLNMVSRSELNSNTWLFHDNQYLQNGQDDGNGVRIIYPGGFSYGPYWNVPSGDYRITILGKKLDKADIEVYSHEGREYHDYKVVSNNDGKLLLSAHLEEEVSNLEIAVKNNTEENIELYLIELRRGD